MLIPFSDDHCPLDTRCQIAAKMASDKSLSSFFSCDPSKSGTYGSTFSTDDKIYCFRFLIYCHPLLVNDRFYEFIVPLFPLTFLGKC